MEEKTALKSINRLLNRLWIYKNSLKINIKNLCNKHLYNSSNKMLCKLFNKVLNSSQKKGKLTPIEDYY